MNKQSKKMQDLEAEIQKKIDKREARKKRGMKVSGAGVKKIQKIIMEKNKKMIK